MKLGLIDGVIIIAYLAGIVLIGLWQKNKAKASNESYMLGGKVLPWYALGLSNASGMFDISGTMWMVMLAFIYGLKSVWIPWLWPSFNQVFLMIFLAVWLRRSNVMTGAEWMMTRFGNGRDTIKSHIIVVAFALLSCLGFLAYGFIGLGKFVEIFIPWSAISPFMPFDIAPEYVPHFYGVIFTCFAVFYSIIGGMASIVWADVLQYTIMTAGAITIGIMAMVNLGDSTLVVPGEWWTPFFGNRLNMDWSGIIEGVNAKIKSDGFSLFSLFFSLMLFKGILASLAGPTPNYDMQKILSTKTPAEAAKMSGFVSIVLIPTRYMMIVGFAILAILQFDLLGLRAGGEIDFEQILPAALQTFAPVGILGLVLAGLLASFIGTFAGTLNAAQAYIVNDIYLKYFNPRASNKLISNVNYLTGITVVLISMVIGFYSKDVNSILQWIVSGLYGGYIASNVLKWYWWRFNSNGFFWGMLSGIIPALIFPYFFDGLALYYFPLLFAISLSGSIIGTLVSQPTDIKTLKHFYKTVRPWGFWKPIDQLVKNESPGFQENKNFTRDMWKVAIGIVAQMCLTLIPFYLILRMYIELGITCLVLAAGVIILKITWWNKLSDDEEEDSSIEFDTISLITNKGKKNSIA